MIKKHGGFLKGDTVEFLNHEKVWTRGEVVHVESAEHRIEGPGGAIVEKKPSTVSVKYFSSVARQNRIKHLPVADVRLAK